jgi:hypothetical protein
MAATPADTQREIERLRGDMTAALDEMQRRFQGGLRGIAGAEARISSGRAADDISSRARQNPTLVGVAGVVVVGAIGYGIYALVKSRQEQKRPQHRLRRRVESVREELSGRVGEGVQLSRQQIERAKQSNLLVKLEPQDGGFMRITEARLEGPPGKGKGRQDEIKKLVWAGLLSVFMAVGSVLARRVAGGVWKVTVREDPPTEKSKAES